MVLLTAPARWMRFQKYASPVSTAKMLKNMSISQIDNFAASIHAAAMFFGIDLDFHQFNRLTGNIDFTYKGKHSKWGWNSNVQNYVDDFEAILLFLKYIYKIDTQNKFVKEFVANGNTNKFNRLYDLLTCEELYYKFKKIKKTQDLIHDFFKKIKLWNEYSSSILFWESHKVRINGKEIER